MRTPSGSGGAQKLAPGGGTSVSFTLQPHAAASRSLQAGSKGSIGSKAARGMQLHHLAVPELQKVGASSLPELSQKHLGPQKTGQGSCKTCYINNYQDNLRSRLMSL